jgi:3-deoxy-D-manno-octulosonic-acid transferase
VKEIEKDKRLSVSFLGEICLENNSRELDSKLLRKVTHMCNALKIVNAHAFIRSKYLESHAPEVILSPFLIKMWFDVVGKLDHDRISKSFSNANISERSVLGYEELEKILTQGLMLRGALPDINEE